MAEVEKPQDNASPMKTSSPESPKAAVDNETLKEYFDSLLYPMLSTALAECARLRPADPVEFVGEFLLKSRLLKMNVDVDTESADLMFRRDLRAIRSSKPFQSNAVFGVLPKVEDLGSPTASSSFRVGIVLSPKSDRPMTFESESQIQAQSHEQECQVDKSSEGGSGAHEEDGQAEGEDDSESEADEEHHEGASEVSSDDENEADDHEAGSNIDEVDGDDDSEPESEKGQEDDVTNVQESVPIAVAPVVAPPRIPEDASRLLSQAREEMIAQSKRAAAIAATKPSWAVYRMTSNMLAESKREEAKLDQTRDSLIAHERGRMDQLRLELEKIDASIKRYGETMTVPPDHPTKLKFEPESFSFDNVKLKSEPVVREIVNPSPSSAYASNSTVNELRKTVSQLREQVEQEKLKNQSLRKKLIDPEIPSASPFTPLGPVAIPEPSRTYVADVSQRSPPSAELDEMRSSLKNIRHELREVRHASVERPMYCQCMRCGVDGRTSWKDRLDKEQDQQWRTMMRERFGPSSAQT